MGGSPQEVALTAMPDFANSKVDCEQLSSSMQATEARLLAAASRLAQVMLA
jgi:hypothetical protein